MMIRPISALILLVTLVNLPASAFALTTEYTITVVDAQCAPIADAEVVVYENEQLPLTKTESPHIISRPCMTDKNGQVSVTGEYKRGVTAMVVARKAGYALGWNVFPYEKLANPNINIILDKPTKFIGRVLDAKGNPLANAKIQAQPKTSKHRRLEQTPIIGPTEWLTSKSDEKGFFVFTCFDQDVRTDILVTAPGSEMTYLFTPHYMSCCGYEVGGKGFCLTLPEEISIAGQVMDDKGNGIANMTVVLDRHGRDDNSSRRAMQPIVTTTDDTGKFHFNRVPSYKLLVTAFNTDSSSLWVDKTIIVDPENNSKLDNLQIQLEKGGLMQVKLIDELTGEPIKGVHGYFSKPPVNENEFWFSRDFETDDDGLTTMRLPVGQVKFSCWSNRYQRQDFEILKNKADSTEKVEFKLVPVKKIKGVVKDIAGNGVKNAKVLVGWGTHVLTDDEGRFESYCDEIKYLFLFARDYRNNTAAIERNGNPDEPYTLTLKPGKTMNGAVVDADNNPVPAARVELVINGPGFLFSTGHEVLTDVNGRFQFGALPESLPEKLSYRVTVATMNHGVADYTRVVIQRDDPNTIELEPINVALANMTIDGIVVDDKGKPAPYKPIFLKGKGQFKQDTYSDLDGRFQFRRLCPGEISLQAGFSEGPIDAGRLTAHSGDSDVHIVFGTELVHLKEQTIKGNYLPGWQTIDFAPETKQAIAGKNLIICIWDEKQLSSRHFVSKLAAEKEFFRKVKNFEIVLIHTSPLSDKTKEWISGKGLSSYLIDFSKQSDSGDNPWKPRSLPWIILTCQNHKVIDEDLTMADLKL